MCCGGRRGRSWNVERHMLTNLAHGEDGETWLDEFSAEYVALLAGLDESSLANAADAWGRTEELQCSGEELLPIVKDLRRLARLSDNRKGLFLWSSL